MIDAWLKSDLDKIFNNHPIAVFIDESGDAEFLLKTIDNHITLHIANSEIDELHVKYLIERERSSSTKYLIYTRTSKKELKFIREYCETNGSIEIRYLQNYIKEKVHQTLNLNINLPTDELIAAAKISVEKDRTYWMDLSHKGATEIFDLKKELLPFIHNPERYEKEKYDPQLREIFYRKVNELIGQEYMPKPAQTLANEVVRTMLDGLAYGSCDKMLDGLAYGSCDKMLEEVYENWLDSVIYRRSFENYLNSYSLPSDVDPWTISPIHPFRQIDDLWLKAIGQNIGNKETLPNFLARISRRHQNELVRALGITFWGDVKILLEFDPKDISYLSSFKECVDFYTKHFYKLDTAIRKLYTEFLNRRDLLVPLQEYYKEILSIFLDKWFQYIDDYQEEQSGLLQRIIHDSTGKTAIVVGDGIGYELANEIASVVNGTFTLKREVVIADVPSETENNMSRIYMDNGLVEKAKANRERYLLAENTDKSLEFVDLDKVSEEARPSQILICTSKDIDSLGEKLQQKALKHFPEAISEIAEKIGQLLNSGYARVYLISDHGFVLTGLLDEADKISVALGGRIDKAERYIRAVDPQPSLGDNFVEIEKTYDEFNYLYFSKSINPFKTPGVYGYSHGGLSPQEILTPFFCWERKENSADLLTIEFSNKNELSSVTGELFQLKLKADDSANNLFALERKVYLVFFSNKEQISKGNVFTIKHGEQLKQEYTFDGKDEIEVLLLDAQTKEQLDKVTVRQNKARDLGGLL